MTVTERSSGTAAGRGQRRGRRASVAQLAEVEALISDLPLRRDLLIEYLHRLQDRDHCLREGYLLALAKLLRIGVAEIHETASFYAHFDIRDDDEAAPEITVRVCDGVSCRLQGALPLCRELEDQLLSPETAIHRAPCMGRCDHGPTVQVGKRHIDDASAEKVAAAVANNQVDPLCSDVESLDTYRQRGGYSILERIYANELTAQQVIDELRESGLRGMGGAGFPTSTKWQIVSANEAPRFLVCNADEGEPGTFKDREILEEYPHQMIEGMLIASACVGCDKAWIYLRDEYPAAQIALQNAIEEAERAGLALAGLIEIRRGAGAYICGEESALIESIEGKKGFPRQRPPYVAEKGVFNRPTLVNNVETLYLVPQILREGGKTFDLGTAGFPGLRSYSVSGRVRQPGIKLAPAGISLRRLIDEYCGGMSDGHELMAYLPGGASGGILPASMDNLPLHFGELEQHGCLIGSAAVIVLSTADDLREVVQALLEFFVDESCGQCTPCRVGTEKMLALLQLPEPPLALLDELAAVMRDASICGLGQAAANPYSAVRNFLPEQLIASDKNV